MGNCSELKASAFWAKFGAGLRQACDEEINPSLPNRLWKKSEAPADTRLFPAPVTSLYHDEAKMMRNCDREHRANPGDNNRRRSPFILGLSKDWSGPWTFVPYSFPRGNESRRRKYDSQCSAPEVVSIEGDKYRKSSQKRAKTCNRCAFPPISLPSET